MMFLVLGALVSAAALVVGTLLDRSVRYGEEVEAHLEGAGPRHGSEQPRSPSGPGSCRRGADT